MDEVAVQGLVLKHGKHGGIRPWVGGYCIERTSERRNFEPVVAQKTVSGGAGRAKERDVILQFLHV
jgi:hypothetical protein